MKLFIPEQQKTAGVGVKTRPAQAERWLTALPVLDVVENTRKIHTALSALNRCVLKAQTRLSLLELYRKPVGFISHGVAERHIGNAIPLSDKNKAIVDQVRELHTEMAFGYKAVVLDLAAQLPSGLENVELAIPIHRAIRYLTEILLKSYEVYTPVPTGVWNEIHQLYLYGESLGILNEPIKDEINKTRHHNNIGHVYKKALLIGLSNPYRLPFQMVNKIDAYLDRWASLAQLAQTTRLAKKKCQFLIQMDSDQPGMPYPGTPPDSLSQPYQILDTRPLTRSVHLQLTALNTGLKPALDGLDKGFFDARAKIMLRHLVIAWGVNPTRCFSRTDQKEICDLVIGIDAVNYFLNGDKQFELSSEGPELEITLHAAGVFGHRRLKQTRKKFSKQPCQIIDEGASGLGLMIEEADVNKIRVGDLIAVKPADEERGWTVGLVRWIRSPSRKQVNLGIQKLAPSATAVAVQSVEVDARNMEDFKLAVSLPEIQALKQPQTLITHIGMFQPERNLFLETGRELQMVRAKHLLETTRSFEWFEFAVLDI